MSRKQFNSEFDSFDQDYDSLFTNYVSGKFSNINCDRIYPEDLGSTVNKNFCVQTRDKSILNNSPTQNLTDLKNSREIQSKPVKSTVSISQNNKFKTVFLGKNVEMNHKKRSLTFSLYEHNKNPLFQIYDTDTDRYKQIDTKYQFQQTLQDKYGNSS
jgi:hypothetical protein